MNATNNDNELDMYNPLNVYNPLEIVDRRVYNLVYHRRVTDYSFCQFLL